MNGRRAGAAIVRPLGRRGQEMGGIADVSARSVGETSAAADSGVSRRMAFGSTVLVIALCAVLAGWRLSGSFAFLNDDIAQFQTAGRTGFSSDLLLMNMAQHFAPLNRIAHYLLFTIGGVDPRIGAVMAAGLIASLLAATAWMTYELGLSLVRRLLVLTATGTALSVLDSAVWNDTALHILLALVASYLVAAMHLRGIRTYSSGWHIASVVVFTVGLLTQERAAFALPLVILIDVFLLWRNDHLAVRFRRLRDVSRPLLAMALIGAAAAYWIHRTYVAASVAGPAPIATARTALMTLTGYQFPQLAGFQPADPPTGFQQVVVLGVVVACCYGLIVMNRRNSGPILFFFAVFALYWGFLLFSPMIGDGVIEANASRLQNGAYVTVPAYVALFSLECSPSLAGAVQARLSGWRRVAAAALAVGLLFLLTFLTGNSFTADNWSRYRSAHEFWQGAVDSRDEWTAPGVTVVPLQAPASVASDWAVIIGREELLLPLLAPEWAPGDLTGHPVLLTPEGQLKNVALQSLSAVSGSPKGNSGGTGPSCLKATSFDDTFRFDLDTPAAAGPFFARMNYTSEVPNQLRATPAGTGLTSLGDWNVSIAVGTHEILVPLPLERVESFQLDYLSPGTTLCINSLDVVRPVYPEPDGTCTLMDEYGTRLTTHTACP